MSGNSIVKENQPNKNFSNFNKSLYQQKEKMLQSVVDRRFWRCRKNKTRHTAEYGEGNSVVNVKRREEEHRGRGSSRYSLLLRLLLSLTMAIIIIIKAFRQIYIL